MGDVAPEACSGQTNATKSLITLGILSFLLVSSLFNYICTNGCV